SREGAHPPALTVDVGGQAIAPSISSFTPPSGPVGTEVTITGANFTGATGVAFHNTHTMNYSVDSDTQLRAVVPCGATTGPISVMNGAGAAGGALDFTGAGSAPATSTFRPVGDTH